MPLLTPEQLREACEELSNDTTLPSWYTSTLKTIISKNVTINDWNKLLTYVQQLAIDDRNVLSVADLLIAQIIALTEVYDSKADWENLTRTITTGGIITALSNITDDNIVLNANTKIQLKIGNITNAAKIEMTNETSGVTGGRVVISGIETNINRLRIMQVDGLGSPITLNGNNAMMHFTADGLEVPSKFKIGNTSGDYWQFYGDTLSLKGSSHTIESNSGDASITFDDNVLELNAGNKVQVNAPTVNIEADTIVLGDEPTSGGGGVTPITPTDSSDLSCLKVMPTATGSNAVVQVKTDTDKIPFEITKDGNIKYTKVQSGTTYNIFANGSIVNFTKIPSGGSLTTLMILNPEQGLIVKNDLLDVDPSQYMTNLVSPFRIGVKTGGSYASTTGTYVSFDNQLSRIDFKTADTSSDLIYMNGVKLATERYADSKIGFIETANGNVRLTDAQYAECLKDYCIIKRGDVLYYKADETPDSFRFFKFSWITKPNGTETISIPCTYLDVSKINKFCNQYANIYYTYTKTGTDNLVADLQSQIDALNAKSVTYSQLATLKSNNGLVAGTYYRITDYVTKINGKVNNVNGIARSIEHAFDIIVLATSTNTFSEKASAILHSGDTYFANSNLKAWKLWYCFENDTTRFEWADTTNGKGVIYRMIDEFENDLPYDFKNIQFKRYKITATAYSAQSGLVGMYLGFDGTYGATSDTTDFEWYYTFSKRSDDSDLSLIASDNTSYTNSYYVKQVKMEQYLCDSPNYRSVQALNNIVMITSNIVVDMKFGAGSHHDTLVGNADITYSYYGAMFRNNILVGEQSHNNCGECFENNIIGDGTLTKDVSHNRTQCHFMQNKIVSFYGNTFNVDCYGNIIGNQFYGNVIGMNFISNTIGDNFIYNTIGNDFNNNTIGNNSERNVIGNSFFKNSIANLTRNSIGNYCHHNTTTRYINECNISHQFNHNTISAGFGRNIIASGFQDNNISGDYFERNVIMGSFQRNTTSANFSGYRLLSTHNDQTITSSSFASIDMLLTDAEMNTLLSEVFD